MVEGQNNANAECVHHWILDPPAGLKANAFCKKCDQKRVFDNTIGGRSDYNSPIMKQEVESQIARPDRRMSPIGGNYE